MNVFSQTRYILIWLASLFKNVYYTSVSKPYVLCTTKTVNVYRAHIQYTIFFKHPMQKWKIESSLMVFVCVCVCTVCSRYILFRLRDLKSRASSEPNNVHFRVKRFFFITIYLTINYIILWLRVCVVYT